MIPPRSRRLLGGCALAVAFSGSAPDRTAGRRVSRRRKRQADADAGWRAGQFQRVERILYGTARARLKAMHLNTVLAPVSWELIEPTEGHFDFSSVDILIRNAGA